MPVTVRQPPGIRLADGSRLHHLRCAIPRRRQDLGIGKGAARERPEVRGATVRADEGIHQALKGTTDRAAQEDAGLAAQVASLKGRFESEELREDDLTRGSHGDPRGSRPMPGLRPFIYGGAQGFRVLTLLALIAQQVQAGLYISQAPSEVNDQNLGQAGTSRLTLCSGGM